jgi:hypothetical protein
VTAGDPLVSLEERRSSQRQQQHAEVCLISLRGCEVLRCRLHDVSDAGVYVSAPIGFGVAVGQRFEVLLGADSANEPNPRRLSPGEYATVVRTRVDVGSDGDSVGVALRFDRPRMGSA